MSQYCGTYEGGVRDDRVQVVTTAGEQVVTVQDSGVEGGQLLGGGDFMTLTAYDRATAGTYLYDFEAGRLLRLSEGQSQWSVASGPTPATSSSGASGRRRSGLGTGRHGPPRRDHPLTVSEARTGTGAGLVSERGGALDQ